MSNKIYSEKVQHDLRLNSCISQRIFRKLFPRSKILNEIWNFVNSGNDTEEFSYTISRNWKKFPENLLPHDPKL